MINFCLIILIKQVLIKKIENSIKMILLMNLWQSILENYSLSL